MRYQLDNPSIEDWLTPERYKKLPQILKEGSKILLNDGSIELEVKKLTKENVICVAKTSGELSNHKSINLPGIKTDMPYLSEQDKSDILFAKEMGADFLSISFVSYKEDVLAVKKYLKDIHFLNVGIISKIESEDGVKNFDKILAYSDNDAIANPYDWSRVENIPENDWSRSVASMAYLNLLLSHFANLLQ